MSDIDLYLDQDNELKFNIAIEGSKQGSPSYRLMLENGDYSYVFAGQKLVTGEVCVVIPKLKSSLKEGNYKAKLEVMIDDRYFVPLEFKTNFTQSVSVVAEHVSRSTPVRTGVTATLVTASNATTRGTQPVTQTRNIIENSAKSTNSQSVQNAKKGSVKTVAKTIKESVDGMGIELSPDELRDLIRLSLKKA